LQIVEVANLRGAEAYLLESAPVELDFPAGEANELTQLAALVGSQLLLGAIRPLPETHPLTPVKNGRFT
jgi:hypothetical protein